ncbi:MAG: DUF4388 domain-containing protein [Myxococcota bacterium]|nr:DUF4388 domain-containing protein [Myxococcota bacterium]
MAKRNLLLVDADSRSLRVLEVSLRKAGYSVTSCASAEEALEFVELARPDLILSDTVLGELDGFGFVERLRERKDLADVPLMFLSSDGSVESKVRGLELGVEDYLAKPIYIKEIITRVNLVLQRFERQGLERRSLTKTRFSGSLSEMGLVDLLQTIDISRKSGVLHLSHGDKRGAVFFDEGSLAHAELGALRGEHAVYRFLVWNDGHFDLEFRPVRIGERTIQTSTQGLLMEGMRRVDEWGRMLEQLPPLDRIFEVDDASLVERLAEIPDELNDLLRLFDGQRSLMQVVDDRSTDDLATLESITKLYFEGLIVDSGRAREDDESFEEEALLPAPGRANADASSLSRASTVPSRAAPDDGNSSESEGSSSLFPEGTERAGPSARSSGVPPPEGPPLDAGAPPEPRTPKEPSSDPSEPPASETEPATRGHSDSSEPSNAAREVSEVPAKDVGSSAQSPRATDARVGAAVTTDPADSDPAVLDAVSGPADSTSENEAASADPEASMAKKGNRRRKRSKTRESIPESNVIQFPAQKAAAAEAALATVTTRDDESGQHRVEAEREAERKQRLEEAAAKRAKAQQRRADAEAKRADSDVKKAESEALRAEAEAKSAEAEAKRFDVKRAEAEVKKAEAELKKAEAQKDDDAAKTARDAAQAKRDAAEAFAKEADALEAEAQSLGDGVGALERASIALQNEAKDLIAAADALEAEATAIETAPPTVGVAVDADEEERASEPPKSKGSEAPKAKASEPPKKDSKTESRKSEPPQKGKSEASSKSEPPKKHDPKAKIKEARTSSSQTIKAITTSGEHAAVAEEFFTAKAYEAEIEHETWDDLELDKVVQGDTKWRRMTLGFVAAGVLVIGGYWLYHNVLMPTPVELTNTPSIPAMPDMSNVGTMEAETAEPAEATPTEATAEATDVAPIEEVAPTEEGAPTEEVAPAEEAAEVAEAAPAEEVVAEPAAPAAAPGAYEALLEEARNTRNPRAKIAKLEEALAANPNGAEALEELGWIQLNRGQNAVAAELAQRASVLLPTSSKVWITLGAARQALRDSEGAQAAYRSCIEQGQGQYVAECRRMAR